MNTPTAVERLRVGDNNAHNHNPPLGIEGKLALVTAAVLELAERVNELECHHPPEERYT